MVIELGKWFLTKSVMFSVFSKKQKRILAKHELNFVKNVRASRKRLQPGT